MFLSFGCVSDAGACGSHVAAAEAEAGSGRGGTVSPRLHCVTLPRGQASPEPDRKQKARWTTALHEQNIDTVRNPITDEDVFRGDGLS